MGNLENFGVCDLSPTEFKSLNGGVVDPITAGVVVAIVGAVLYDWDDFTKGISDALTF